MLRGDVTSAFSVELKARPDDLGLEIEGFGPVKFPVTPAKARKLIELGQPARFGRGEETVTDPDVRDTWEIPRHRVRATWNPAMLHVILTTIKEELGLPDGAELMVGRNEEWKAYRGSATTLSLVAFYADCQHEVLHVQSGYLLDHEYTSRALGWTRLRAPTPPACPCCGQRPSGPATRPSSSAWALDELAAMVATGDRAGAREAANTLRLFWDGAVRGLTSVEKGPVSELLAKALRTADAVENRETATMLLRPFSVENLAVSHAGPFAATVVDHGHEWTADLLQAWFTGRQPTWAYTGTERQRWVSERLRSLGMALDTAGGAAGDTARLMLELSALRARLDVPVRADGDWSISLPPGGCTCDTCATLKAFLSNSLPPADVRVAARRAMEPPRLNAMRCPPRGEPREVAGQSVVERAQAAALGGCAAEVGCAAAGRSHDGDHEVEQFAGAGEGACPSVGRPRGGAQSSCRDEHAELVAEQREGAHRERYGVGPFVDGDAEPAQWRGDAGERRREVLDSRRPDEEQ